MDFKLSCVPFPTTPGDLFSMIGNLTPNCVSFLQNSAHTVFARRMQRRVYTLPPLENVIVV